MARTKPSVREIRMISDTRWQADQMPDEHVQNLLWDAARRAELNEWFLAHAIVSFADLIRVGRRDVMKHLGLDDEMYYRLALCRRPRRAEREFDSQVERIAAFTGCCRDAISDLLNELEDRGL